MRVKDIITQDKSGLYTLLYFYRKCIGTTNENLNFDGRVHFQVKSHHLTCFIIPLRRKMENEKIDASQYK